MIQQKNLPGFSKIDHASINSDLEELLKANREDINRLFEVGLEYSWDTLIVPLEEMDDRLNKFWSPVRHLKSVADNELLRKTYNECLQKITEYYTDLMQDERLFHAYEKIYNSSEYHDMGHARQKVIEDNLRDFRLSGVGLQQAKKTEYKNIVQDLTRAESTFEENVLDATQAWTKTITDKSLLLGLPDTVVQLAKKHAEDRDIDGWVITLDFPSYYPVMQNADNAELRQEVYEAYVTRASSFGPGNHEFDNSKYMQEILGLRKQKAGLLGFDNYAEYSLARKMAKTPEEVLSFLEELSSHSVTVATKEFSELQTFAREHYQHQKLEPWDVAYFSEKLKHHRFEFTQEDVRPYFPVDAVLNGLFTIVNKLYGLKIQQMPDIDVWHPDVKFYVIYDANGDQRGGFYLDLFARKNKRGGAWMDECVIRKNLSGELQLPAAYLSCNFSPPVNDKPSLLTHDEVTTLFHEFGHGLHHKLTLINYPPVAGINGVPWDAVELPSQFMENWCW
ncbi:MAG: M3 family metallopeptidase, partial [Gammaproteobacteria bacterium]|nr:M3 family metallopeptidase [Gammaproteobacteria bacterium]